MIESAFPTTTAVSRVHSDAQLRDPEHAKSPSALYRKEAQIHYHASFPLAKMPQATEVNEVCNCAMCGTTLSPNSTPPHKAIPITKDLFGNSFNNKMDIKKGNVVCGDCEALWTGEFMQTHSKSYAVEGHGLLRLASSLNIAAFVLHPPQAPYVAIFNTRKLGHLIWRTPIQYPGNELTVRLDDDLIIINRERSMAGVRAWQYIKERLKILKLKTKEPALLSANLDFSNVGFILPVVIDAMMNDGPKSAQALADLHALAVGDWWVLSAMRNISMDDPATWPNAEMISPIIIGNPKKTQTLNDDVEEGA